METKLLPALKRSFLILCLLALYFPVTFTVAQRAATPLPPAATTYNKNLNAAPLLFTENRGQVADAGGNLRPDILFTAHSNGAKVFLTSTGIHYQFEKTIFPQGYESDNRQVKDLQKQVQLQQLVKTETYRFTLSLQGANPAPKVRKEEQNTYTENFYLAQCPAGITNVHTYGRLVYENVYPGIDWIIYTSLVGGDDTLGAKPGEGATLKYDFSVHPGADPALIQLTISDAQSVQIDKEGSLVMSTVLGEVKEAAPVSYCGGAKVATSFVQSTNGTISFAISTYDKSDVLTIDPSVTWATYYGGSGSDYGYSCAVDDSSNVYLAGSTSSTTGFASGGFQNTYGGSSNDAFLTKFNSSGSRLWATYYGGSDFDGGRSCAVDGNGNVYLAGYTSSTTGIASGGFQNTNGGYYDAYLAKFNSSGSRLWATYYGGSSSEDGMTCAVDDSGNVYFAGLTGSSTGIASGGFQNTYNDSDDAFLVKFSSSGSRLWATYYGGSNQDYASSCAVDDSGNVYFAGRTRSNTDIASGGFQNTLAGNADAYLVKFNSSGSRLWATYYGGSSYDEGYSCAVDGGGNVYITGYTWSTSGIAFNGFQNTHGGTSGSDDAYLVKFSSNGSRLWATYYGGTGQDEGKFCAVDSSGNVYLAGITRSSTGIASGGVQNIYGGGGYPDAFLAKFSSSGSRLWATYYGGSGFDEGYSCAVEGGDNVYLAGWTSNTTGIAFNGFQNTFGGSSDAFLAKINGGALQSFTSVANGNWNNPSIWSGGVVPTTGSAVIINTTITVTANASCYSIIVNPSGSITVSSGVTLTVLH